MMKHVVAVLALLSLGACCCGVPTDAEERRHAVMVEGRYYLYFRDDALPAQGGPVLGAEHARVARQIPCAGIIIRDPGIEDPCGFQDGDSSLLAAGTTLHPVDGVPAGQRLGGVWGDRLFLFHAYYPPD
ncbi:MAG TPA: hypothetical protein VFR37_00155 [Longimicrobium sp.]|nr:hypothetical protein [Longimicrobium sp.]